MAEFQKWERSVAVAEFECHSEHFGAYLDQHQQIYDEVTEEVVAEYRAELETLAQEY